MPVRIPGEGGVVDFKTETNPGGNSGDNLMTVMSFRGRKFVGGAIALIGEQEVLIYKFGSDGKLNAAAHTNSLTREATLFGQDGKPLVERHQLPQQIEMTRLPRVAMIVPRQI